MTESESETWQRAATVDETAARAHLDAVADSRFFRNSEKLRRLLAYLVEATLAGDENRLKGYTIGVEALDRPEDFDPQLDPIVRVQAKRLRDALEAFYASEGHALDLRILIEKGAYRPVFLQRLPRQEAPGLSGEVNNAEAGKGLPAHAQDSPRPGAATADADEMPRVRPEVRITRQEFRFTRTEILLAAFCILIGMGAAYLAVQGHTSDPFELEQLQTRLVTQPSVSERNKTYNFLLERPVIRVTSHDPNLRERGDLAFVSVALARFHLFNVLDPIAPDSDRTRPASLATEHYRITLQGCQGCAQSVVSATIIFVPKNEIIYSSTFGFDPDNPSNALIKLIRTITAIDGPLMMHHHQRTDIETPTFDCFIHGMEFAKTFTAEAREKLRGCTDRYENAGSTDPLMDQLTAFSSVVSYWLLEDAQNNLARAQRFSRRALETDAMFPAGYFVRSLVFEAMGNSRQAIAMAQRAHELNPLDSILAFGLANSLLNNNQPRRAREILENVRAESQSTPVWIAVRLAMAYLLEGNISAMQTVVPEITGSDTPLGHLLVLIACTKGDDNADIIMAYNNLKATSPLLLRPNIARLYIETHFRNRTISERMITEMRQAVERAEMALAVVPRE